MSGGRDSSVEGAGNWPRIRALGEGRFQTLMAVTPIEMAIRAFGAALAVESLRWGWFAGNVARGDGYWAVPYPGMSWWPQPGAISGAVELLLIGVLGLLILAGLGGRAMFACAWFAWTHWLLSDAVRYSDHGYLLCLLGVALVFVPTWPSMRLRGESRPQVIGRLDPFASIILVRIVWIVVFGVAGVARFGADWWTQGEPLRIAMSDWIDIGPVGAVAIARIVPAAYLAAAILLCVRPEWFLGVAFGGAALFVDRVFLGDGGIAAWIVEFVILAVCWNPSWARETGSGNVFSATSATGTKARRFTPAMLIAGLVIVVVPVLLAARNWFGGDIDWQASTDLFTFRASLSKRESLEFEMILEEATEEGGIDSIDHQVVLDVRAPQIDWRTLPVWVTTMEPVVGRRVVLNRWAGKAQTPIDEDRIAELVADRFGDSEQYNPSTSLSETLDEIRRKVRALASVDATSIAIDEAIQQAMVLAKPALTDSERRRIVSALRTALETALRDEAVQADVRSTLAKIAPFQLQGGDAPATGAIIVMGGSTDDADGTAELHDRDGRMIADFSTWREQDWRELEAKIPCVDPYGGAYSRWNTVTALGPSRRRFIAARPWALAAYAKYVAAGDPAAQHSVFVQSKVRINAGPAELVVDPTVDAAAMRPSDTGDNTWLRPPRAFHADRVGRADQAIERGIRALSEENFYGAGDAWVASKALKYRRDSDLEAWVARWVGRNSTDPSRPLLEPDSIRWRVPADPGRGYARYEQILWTPFAKPDDLAIERILDFVRSEETGYVLTHQLAVIEWAREMELELPAWVYFRRFDLMRKIATELTTQEVFDDLLVEQFALLLAYGDMPRQEATDYVDRIISEQAADGLWYDHTPSVGKLDGETFSANMYPAHTTGLAVWALCAYLDRYE